MPLPVTYQVRYSVRPPHLLTIPPFHHDKCLVTCYYLHPDRTKAPQVFALLLDEDQAAPFSFYI